MDGWRIQRGLAWVGIVVLAAFLVLAVVHAPTTAKPLHGAWSGRELTTGEPVSMQIPGLFSAQGLPGDGRILLERTVHLPSSGQHALWLERPEYAVAVHWDGQELARQGDPDQPWPVGRRTERPLLVWLPSADPATPHVLGLEVSGAFGDGGLTGNVRIGPVEEMLRRAERREAERMGLALLCGTMGIIQLAVAANRRSRMGHLLFGFFAGLLAVWASSQAAFTAELLELESRLRLRRVVGGLMPGAGVAFVAAFLQGRPRRAEWALLVGGAFTAVFALTVPMRALYVIEDLQDVMTLGAVLWGMVLCLQGVMQQVRWSQVLLVVTFPPLLLGVLSEILETRGMIAGGDAVVPAVGFFAMALSVAMALRHAGDAARHERLLVGSPDAIVSIDKDGRVESANPAAVALLGPRARGRPLSEWIAVRDRPLLNVHLSCGVPRAELRLETYPDRVFESVATALDEGVLLVLRDVTRRRELDGAVLQAARLETVGVLVGGIAHDFNNMLGTLLAQLGFLQMQLSRDASLSDRLQRMEATIERASLLIRRMLTVSRGTTPELGPVDLVSLCAGARDLVEPTLPEAVSLVLDVPEDLAPVLGAGPDLEQVVVNLLVNARDAVGSRGHLALRGREVVTGDGTRAVVLVVEDDGPGVADERKGEVFLPFVSSKSPRHGSGLGLAVSAQIVRDHLGRLWVEDRPGGGARFLAALRVAVSEPETGGLPEGRRVLLVEDEQELLESYVQALQSAGYEVRAFATGSEATDALAAEAPDILVTDVVLPGTSGIELAETCNALHPHVPVLLVSGYIPQERSGRLAQGRWYRLDKPVRPGRLVAEVGRIRRRAEHGGKSWESQSFVQSREGTLQAIRGADLDIDVPAWTAKAAPVSAAGASPQPATR